MNHQSYSLIIIIALVLFSIYRRVRRNIGWQLLKPGNLVFRIVLFVIIGLIFFAESVVHPISLFSDVIGVILGCILAYYGVTLTNIEHREGKLYYKPNSWIGSTVTVLFLVRFIYRFYGLFSSGALSGMQPGQTNGMQNFGYTGGSSWASGLILIMFAYYTIYYLVLLKKQRQFTQSKLKD